MTKFEPKPKPKSPLDEYINIAENLVPKPQPGAAPTVYKEEKKIETIPIVQFSENAPINPQVYYNIAVAKVKAEKAIKNFKNNKTLNNQKKADKAIDEYNKHARNYEKATGKLPENTDAPFNKQLLKPDPKIVKNKNGTTASSSGDDTDKINKPYDGPFAFDQNMVQGQIQYYYKGNGNNMIPVALVAGSNGKYLPHSQDYSTVYSPDGSLITDTGIADNSPQTFSEATSYLINELYKTPDGVKKFKELLIAKNIIPPSAAATAMIDPTQVDKTTFDAIQYLVGAVTAHNVVIANKSGAKAAMWSVQDWLNNMTPLSNTKTETTTVHQRINPKDYEISIDKMFQDTIGRGATAEELKHFSESLQNYANANPEKRTTTTTEGATGNTSTMSVSGGVSSEAAAAMMRDEALQNPEAESYTKGAKYFDWFQQAVNNTLQLGG